MGIIIEDARWEVSRIMREQLTIMSGAVGQESISDNIDPSPWYHGGRSRKATLATTFNAMKQNELGCTWGRKRKRKTQIELFQAPPLRIHVLPSLARMGTSGGCKTWPVTKIDHVSTLALFFTPLAASNLFSRETIPRFSRQHYFGLKVIVAHVWLILSQLLYFGGTFLFGALVGLVLSDACIFFSVTFESAEQRCKDPMRLGQVVHQRGKGRPRSIIARRLATYVQRAWCQIGVFELVDRDFAGISFGGVRGRWEAACTKYDGGVSTSVFRITSSSIESHEVHDVYMFLFYP